MVNNQNWSAAWIGGKHIPISRGTHGFMRKLFSIFPQRRLCLLCYWLVGLWVIPSQDHLKCSVKMCKVALEKFIANILLCGSCAVEHWKDMAVCEEGSVCVLCLTDKIEQNASTPKRHPSSDFCKIMFYTVSVQQRVWSSLQHFVYISSSTV